MAFLGGCRSCRRPILPSFVLGRLRWSGLVSQCGRPRASWGSASRACTIGWIKQDRVDRAERPGLSRQEHADLVAAKPRIRQLETELEILREASRIYEELKGDPKGRSR